MKQKGKNANLAIKRQEKHIQQKKQDEKIRKSKRQWINKKIKTLKRKYSSHIRKVLQDDRMYITQKQQK